MTDERTFCLPGSVPLPLVAVPAGSFSMGSPAGETGHQPEETAHRVTLTRGFYLGRAPVTRRQWAALMEGKAPAAAEKSAFYAAVASNVRPPIADPQTVTPHRRTARHPTSVSAWAGRRKRKVVNSMTTKKTHDDIRKRVLNSYAGIATGALSGCGCATPSCCSSQASIDKEQSAKLGYSKKDMDAVPEGADMGLGCGNPQAIAALKKGEVVLDLGAGGGFDCFLAARQVGQRGRVIGVDMTPEMVAKARENGRNGGFKNVEFRLGEIEHLPVADNSVDVILSNCVINLSPDKEQVYREAFRVLKPGGRLAISDVVAVKPVPKAVRDDFDKHSGCVAGALHVRTLDGILRTTGFLDGRVMVKEASKEFIKDWFPGSGIERYVRSADVQGIKPVKA